MLNGALAGVVIAQPAASRRRSRAHCRKIAGGAISKQLKGIPEVSSKGGDDAPHPCQIDWRDRRAILNSAGGTADRRRAVLFPTPELKEPRWLS